MEEENRFKLEDVLKVISTVTTLLFAASEVLRQARLMKKEQNSK
jgi:predicted house-cleaning noncanonical NTP pyrophosphatase (MazG superfamily)